MLSCRSKFVHRAQSLTVLGDGRNHTAIDHNKRLTSRYAQRDRQLVALYGGSFDPITDVSPTRKAKLVRSVPDLLWAQIEGRPDVNVNGFTLN